MIAPATTDAKNIMPRVAALLDAMVISDVQEVKDAETFVRPIYAGNAIQTVKSSDATKVVTIRTSTFDAAGLADRPRSRTSPRARIRACRPGRGQDGGLGPAGTDLGQDRDLGWARHG